MVFLDCKKSLLISVFAVTSNLVDLNDAVKKNIDLITDLNIQFIVSKLPEVRGDSVRIFQLFKNLFENARIHGKAGSITITSIEHDKEFEIQVENDGIPISQEVKLQFNSSEFLNNNKEKGGLGLAIIKRVAESHNWKIKLSKDTMTSFSILIPKSS